MPVVVPNADADSFDQMIANRLEPDIQFPFARRFRRCGVACRRNPLSGSHQGSIRACTGWDSWRGLGGCAGAADIARREGGVGLFAPELRRHARRGCLHPGAVARYDRMSAAVAASLPYSVIRHTAIRRPSSGSPRRGSTCAASGWGFTASAGSTMRACARFRRSNPHRADRCLEAGDAVGYGRARKLLRPTVTATVPIGYADGLDRHLGCGRWSMRGRAACADRGPRLHGQLHDRTSRTFRASARATK